MIQYSREIFDALSKGAFISADSTSPQVRRWYDALDDGFQEYRAYYEGVGFILESGDGFFYFSRKESKADLQRKLEVLLRWIDYIDFLKTFNSTFGPGFEFIPSDIVIAISGDVELKDKAGRLFPGVKNFSEVAEKLTHELEGIGFAEPLNVLEGSYRVTSAFHYIEEMMDIITISEEVKDEIPE
jgi:hypothetical protein